LIIDEYFCIKIRPRTSHIDNHSHLNTWRSNSTGRSLDVIRCRFFFQLITRMSFKDHSEQPVHIQAQSKLTTWNTDRSQVKRIKIKPKHFQRIHVETRSKIDSWRDESVKVDID
jgi:hypothetical protein